MRIARLAMLVALAAGLLATAGCGGGSSPSVFPKERLTVAIQDDRLPVAPQDALAGRLARVAATGVRWTRVDVLWNDIAPSRPVHGSDPKDPAYRWGRLDAIVDGLARRHVRTMLDIFRTPSWANGGKGIEWAPDLDDYGDFVSALAARYDGGHGHSRVSVFEPWNEPNLGFFLEPQWDGQDGSGEPASPRVYAGLLGRAYEAVKAAQPDAMVLGVTGGPTNADQPPNLSVGIVTFVRALADLHPRMDGVAQHVYPAASPKESVAIPSYRSLPELIKEFDRIKPGLPVFITELGYTTAASPYRKAHVTDEQQVEYMRQAFDALAAIPQVRLGVWFNLQDNPGWPAGLLRNDGSEKPSWAAFQGLPKTVASAAATR